MTTTFYILRELETFGFCIQINNTIEILLICKENVCRMRGNKSILFLPTSGVPQGFNLVPILGLIFINNIVGSFHCETLLFADDMKIFYEIDAIEACVTFQ